MDSGIGQVCFSETLVCSPRVPKASQPRRAMSASSLPWYLLYLPCPCFYSSHFLASISYHVLIFSCFIFLRVSFLSLSTHPPPPQSDHETSCVWRNIRVLFSVLYFKESEKCVTLECNYVIRKCTDQHKVPVEEGLFFVEHILNMQCFINASEYAFSCLFFLTLLKCWSYSISLSNIFHTDAMNHVCYTTH